MTDPTSATRGRGIYRGWYVLAVGVLAGALSAGSSQMVMGSLLLVITQDTGWSHTVISTALLLGTIAGGGLSPVAGAWTDRHGPRLLMTVAAVALAMGFAVLGYSPWPWVFYLGYMVARTAAQAVLGGVSQRALAVNWFQRYRGRAMGIVTMAVPLGAAALAMGAQWLLQRGVTWREVFYVYAGLTLVLLPLPAALLLRRGPEELGLYPDGVGAEEHEQRHARRMASERGSYVWTLGQALRTRSLKLLILASVIAGGANGAVVFYHVAFLVSRGITPVNAVTALSTLALTGALANLVWGYLAERMSERTLAIISQALAAGAVLAILTIHTTTQAIAMGMLLGLLVRGESSLTSIIVARYFGRFAYGRITGFMATFQLIALGLGPVAGALIYDTTGAYPVLYGAVALGYLAASLLFWLARRPPPPTASTAGA